MYQLSNERINVTDKNILINQCLMYILDNDRLFVGMLIQWHCLTKAIFTHGEPILMDNWAQEINQIAVLQLEFVKIWVELLT